MRKTLASGDIVEYHYAWRGGPKFWQSGSGVKVGSAEYLQAMQEVEGQTLDRSNGLFRSIIRQYLKSNEFQGLAARTQADYKVWTGRIDAKFGDAPIASFNNPKIRPLALKWRDQWKGKQAQYAFTVLKRIVSWGYDRGLLQYHHLRGGGSVYSTNRAEVIFTTADIVAFHQIAPKHVSRALTAAIETGEA